MNVAGRAVSSAAQSSTDPGPGPSRSSSSNNNNTYVLPGLSSLSALLSESFNQLEDVDGLDDLLARDIAMYEQKAARYRSKLKKAADEEKRAEGEKKEIKLEDPLKFWYSQVSLIL